MARFRGACLALAMVAFFGLTASVCAFSGTPLTRSPALRAATQSASPSLHSARSSSMSSSSPAAFALLASGACGLGLALLGRRAQVSAARVARRAKEYWEGEWICADCGYIYNERSFGSKFEDLKMGFKCPQCAAPRRRFARKLGDKIGTTLDGGDTPIIIFSAVALFVVIAIAYYSLQ
eukprot:TRINITY_DN473_c0_g1_i1.p1 TRINITY_DN473_c0_g1~~TRINITY_DN473_c0_g1_i1.p1  ORF type:complete len:197 (+),score=38.63 TRINITY_DN473_c0_g1_i1:57-593(+)